VRIQKRGRAYLNCTGHKLWVFPEAAGWGRMGIGYKLYVMRFSGGGRFGGLGLGYKLYVMGFSGEGRVGGFDSLYRQFKF
jgi:hypothetical protein